MSSLSQGITVDAKCEDVAPTVIEVQIPGIQGAKGDKGEAGANGKDGRDGVDGKDASESIKSIGVDLINNLF